jgi:hypothetical protein
MCRLLASVSTTGILSKGIYDVEGDRLSRVTWRVFLLSISIEVAKITLQGYECERCTHQWVPRQETKEEPKVCPKCKSPYWNPHRQKPKIATNDRYINAESDCRNDRFRRHLVRKTDKARRRVMSMRRFMAEQQQTQ